MLFEYETQRLLLKIIKPEYGSSVLDFYLRDICFFNILHAPCYCCEVGYKFSSRIHHRGYATEALTALTNTVFKELNMHRIAAYVEPGNVPSIHLLERVGFVREGLCREHSCQHGIWVDHLQYSLLPLDLR